MAPPLSPPSDPCFIRSSNCFNQSVVYLLIRLLAHGTLTTGVSPGPQHGGGPPGEGEQFRQEWTRGGGAVPSSAARGQGCPQVRDRGGFRPRKPAFPRGLISSPRILHTPAQGGRRAALEPRRASHRLHRDRCLLWGEEGPEKRGPGETGSGQLCTHCFFKLTHTVSLAVCVCLCSVVSDSLQPHGL